MKNNFEITIGIEIHLELNTKTKMFSDSLNDFNSAPNTNIQPMDLGYPGTLPRVNKGAVLKGIKLGKALHTKIASTLTFDRKNYFYPDLPKGFQITQDDNPIGSEGYVTIGDKKIRVQRIHLEEDTAKSHHKNGKTLLDFNRAGVPLIEIVTHPDITSADEAVSYIEIVREIALSQNVSDAKMEEGSLRADVNISIRPRGQEEYGTRVEVKNMNSLSNVRKAIESEVAQQMKDLVAGKAVIQATKRFDEEASSTIMMREKTDAVDYKYFPEPNIPEIMIPISWVDSIKLDELPWERKARYIQEGVEHEYIDLLLLDIDKANFFDSIKVENKTKLARVFFAEIVALANIQNKSVADLGMSQDEIAVVFVKLDSGEISGKHVKQIFPELIGGEKTVEQIIEEKGMKQISDKKEIKNFVQNAISNNQDFINQNKQRPERVLKYIVGQVMKDSRGQANPVVTNEIASKMIGE